MTAQVSYTTSINSGHGDSIVADETASRRLVAAML